MKIAIDLSQLAPQRTGIEYYTHELVKALINTDDKNEYLLVTNSISYLDEISTEKENVEIRIFESRKVNFLWLFRMGMWLRTKEVDFLVSPSNLMLNVWFPRTIQIIHDIAPITHPQYWNLESIKSFKYQLNLAMNRAKKVVTISETSKNEIEKHFPVSKGKVDVIGVGINDWVRKEISDKKRAEVIDKYDIPKNYFLSVSTVQPRKNYEGMIKAFKIFLKKHPGYKYFISGKKGWLSEPIYNLVDELDLKNKVIFLGYTDEEDLPVFYEKTKALLLCSHAEGFGLTAIEAYFKGVPSVVSDIPVFRESMGDNAIFVDPDNPADIALGYEKVVSRTFVKDEGFLKQYSWDNVASNLIKIFNEIND